MTRTDKDIAKLKADILDGLQKSMGNISHVCIKNKISKATFYQYKATDPVFAEAIKESTEFVKDYVVSKLLECVSEKNITAIIFYLKKQCPELGYGDTPVQIINNNILPTVIDWTNHTENKPKQDEPTPDGKASPSIQD